VQNMAEAVKYLIEFLIVIIHVCQLEQEVYPILAFKLLNGFFEQGNALFLLIQGQVSVGFENIDIDIAAVQYFGLFQEIHGIGVLAGSDQEICFFNQKRGGIGILFN